MYDFLFISDPTTMASSHAPYYFLYLAGYLRARGFMVKILDYKSRAGYRRRADHYWDVWLPGELNGNPARFTCLSCYTPHYLTTLKLGDMVKAVQPRTTLVVGNAHATVRSQDFLYDNSPFDYVVIGEGEGPLRELGKGATFPPGTARLDESGRMEIAPRAELIPDRKIATPAYDLIDMDWYLRPQKDLIRHLYTRSAYVFTSRGCLHDCDFCATNVIWKANRGKRFRHRTLATVFNEIRKLKREYGAEFIYIADDSFGSDRGWLTEWFTWYDGDGLLPYAVQTRADTVTEEMVQSLGDTGCLQLDIGVESGSQRLLDAVHKGITVEQVERVSEWCGKYGLRLFVFLMVNLPGETEADLAATERLMEKIRTVGCTVSVCTPYPGTRLHDLYVGTEFGNDYADYVENRGRYRMSAHSLDLGDLTRTWSRRWGAEPIFERMWPKSRTYWRTVWRSRHKTQYLRAWAADLPRTFALWWVRRLGLVPLLKRVLGM